MKKSLWILGVVVMLAAVVAFANVSPAFATSYNPEEQCEDWGGTWTSTGENTGKCAIAYPPDDPWSQFSCPAGYSAVDLLEYDGIVWWWVGTSCKTGYSTTSQTNTDVIYGKPVDAWNGNCGAYISSPPLSGTVTISKVTMPEGPNRQTICKANYTDFQGNTMANFGSPGWVYYNLNAETAALWNNGQLNMYIYQNDTWQACSNPLFVDAGEYGRLACYSENPIYFGIGTALNGTNSTTGPWWANTNK